MRKVFVAVGLLVSLAVSEVALSQSKEEPKLRCTEASAARTTSDNQGPALLWTYDISPARGDLAPEFAMVEIEGFQTSVAMEVSIARKAGATSYRFKNYAKNSIHQRPDLKPGDELFVISGRGSSAQLSFRKLKPHLKRHTLTCQPVAEGARQSNRALE